jgi:hypothetical protein
MRFSLFLLCLIAGLCGVGAPAYQAAADDTSLARGLQTWEAVPEDPGMRTVCSTELRYATTISAILAASKSKPPGVSTVVALLRGAEHEAEQTASEVPTDPLLAVGTEVMWMNLISHAWWDGPIYQQIPGGFPQWAFRSCLKGKSLGAR